MRGKLKLLAAVIAVCALSAGVLSSASAEIGGHFTVDTANGTIQISESPTHRLEFLFAGFNGILCNEVTRSSNAGPGQTLAWLELPIGNRDCTTTGGNPGEIQLIGNGCYLLLWIGKKAEADNTTNLNCPSGKVLEFIHPNCKIRVPPQAGFKGVSYAQAPEGGKHGLTVKFTLEGGGKEVDANFEEGICVFLGTAQQMVVSGTLTAKANAAGGAQQNLTATG